MVKSMGRTLLAIICRVVMISPPKKCGAGFQPAHSRRVGQVGNLPHTFSSFQGVARDMNDSSEKVAQAGRGCAASAWDEMIKPRNLGPLALRSSPIFIDYRASLTKT